MIIDKKKTLQENWQQYMASCGDDCIMSLAEYVRREAENDPGFFRWLFDNESLTDFECPDKDEFEYMIVQEMSNKEERPVV